MNKRTLLIISSIILLLVGCDKKNQFLTEEEIINLQAYEYKNNITMTEIHNITYSEESLTINDINYQVVNGNLKIGEEEPAGIPREKITSILGYTISDTKVIYCLTENGNVYILNDKKFEKIKIKNIKRLIMLDTQMYAISQKEDKSHVYLIYGEKNNKIYRLDNQK